MSLSIRFYERPDYDRALELLYENRRTHTHIDWYRAGRWLELFPHRAGVAYQGERLVGLMGFSLPLNGASWLRLVAVDDQQDTERILLALWQFWRDQHIAQSTQRVGVMVVYAWLTDYLPQLGFHYDEDIITFFRPMSVLLPPEPKLGAINIKSAYLDDIAELTALDHQTFPPPWQLTSDELRQAQRQAGSYTIAVLDGRIVGYQICTRHQDHAHLARLAVAPTAQGHGIGAALLHHLLHNMERRHVRSMSVNTQMSNLASQKLYTRYGFTRNGYDLPVWLQRLPEPDSPPASPST